MPVYYNDNDPKVCAWLRELIKEGLIADGEVDERSILDVHPGDLAGFTQCHFFAGIGGWSYALCLAGWPDDRPVWTGSCPCQPFSVAGKGLGERDARHLWPEFRRLIAECRPPGVFGEQVASKAGREWLSRVRADLEAMGYGVGAADLCAAGIGAPHIRQRLYWVADVCSVGLENSRPAGLRREARTAVAGSTLRVGDSTRDDERRDSMPRTHREREPIGGPGSLGGLVIPDGGRRTTRRPSTSGDGHGSSSEPAGTDGRMANAGCSGDERGLRSRETHGSDPAHEAEGLQRERRGPDSWSSSVIIPCADGKARRIEPSIEPLVDGLPGRVGLLRGYGNAIVPQVAAEFVMAYLEAV